MYTVLHLTGERSKAEVAADAINATTAGTVSPRARGDGFAASISDSDRWDDHVRALQSYVDAHREPLMAASGSGLSLHLDTMVVQGDVTGRPEAPRVRLHAVRTLRLSTIVGPCYGNDQASVATSFDHATSEG